MQRFPVFIGLVAVFASFGCEHRPATGESVAEVCHPMKDGKLMQVSGYVGASPLSTSCATSCTLRLRAQRTDDSRYIDLVFPIGSDNDQLEAVPLNYTDADIRIKDHSGKEVKGGGVARISGRLSIKRSGDQHCTMFVTRVEAL
jgi:hypothetical protein